jgi:TonB family protein
MARSRLSRTTAWATSCAVAILLAPPPLAAAQGGRPTPSADAPAPGSRLFTSLASFVGADAEDCGRFPLNGGGGRTTDDLQPALACAEAASAARRPFQLYAQHPGRSFSATGLIGTADGRIWRFTYDTSTCTSPDCFGQLSFTRCVDPRLEPSPAGDAVWSCAAEPAELIESIPLLPNQAGRQRSSSPTSEACSGTVSRIGAGPDLDVAWVRGLINRVRRVWVTPREALTLSGKVVVEFDVLRDGTIADIVVTTSVSPALDDASTRAIQAANPSPPLPASYTEAKAHLVLSFCYNL